MEVAKPSEVHVASRLAFRRCALAVFALAIAPPLGACFGGRGGGGDAGTVNSYPGLTVQVTIDGIRWGPAAPDGAAASDFFNSRDTVSQAVTQSSLRLEGSSATAQAGCSASVTRFGPGIAPIAVGGWGVVAATTDKTRDGTVSPLGAIEAHSPDGVWSCSGSSCDGSTVVITRLDNLRTDGYFMGALPSTTGGPAASVVCSFALPARTFSP